MGKKDTHRERERERERKWERRKRKGDLAIDEYCVVIV